MILNTYCQLPFEKFLFFHGASLLRYSAVPPSDYSLTSFSCDPSLVSIYIEKETPRYLE